MFNSERTIKIIRNRRKTSVNEKVSKKNEKKPRDLGSVTFKDKSQRVHKARRQKNNLS